MSSGALPNKRLKLTGLAFRGNGGLCPGQLIPHGGGACAHQSSPRSLSAIR